MRTFTQIILFLLIPIHLFANDDFSSGKLISVRWTLLHNFDSENDNFSARFTIVNRSNFELTERNWNLYFSVAPRTITNSGDSHVMVEHLNGDWFRLRPTKGFTLSPGDSVVVAYQGYPAMIKHNDAPAGLYFTFLNDTGGEELIAPVVDYKFDSFVHESQINRSATDLEPIPTTKWLYYNNLNVSLIPKELVKETIPSPVSVTKATDSLLITSEFKIVYDDKLTNEATYLKNTFKTMLGWDLQLKSGTACKKCFLLSVDRTVKETSESYKLNVSQNGVEIRADSSVGVFYGIQTLRSYVPENTLRSQPKSFHIPARVIVDGPRFEFRGLAVDVARNFQSKETVLKVIDLLAYYKINRLLLLLTDDEGWRIEIEGLPELTSVGGERKHASNFTNPSLHPSYGSGPYANIPGSHGSGFYTKSDFIEIIQFAQSRHIKVIPEFNLPAHAKAAIKAMEARYERLFAEGNIDQANEFRLIDPLDTSRYMSAQSYKDNTANVALPGTFRFASKVVEEIAAMYEEAGMVLDEIHFGGDEVPHGVWTGSPLAHKLIETDPTVKSIADLQPYYFKALLNMTSQKNLQVDIWDDLLMLRTSNGTTSVDRQFVNNNVVPFIWNNIFDNPDLAYKLANAGYKVVMCNVSNFYFDLAYNKDPREPGAYWGGFVDTRDAWGLAPFDMFKTIFTAPSGKKLSSADFAGYEQLTQSARKNVLGVQAQVFSETIKGREMFEYYLLPKLVGFAETAWSKERAWEGIEDDHSRVSAMNVDWNLFANTLASRELPRLKYMGGFNYRVPPPGAIIENGLLKANSEYPGLKIFYSESGQAFREYTMPVQVNGDVILKCTDSSGASSREVKASISKER
jgi:hexosaminidase